MNVFVHVLADYDLNGLVASNLGVVFYGGDEPPDTQFREWFESFQETEPDSDCQFMTYLEQFDKVSAARTGYEPIEQSEHVYLRGA